MRIRKNGMSTRGVKSSTVPMRTYNKNEIIWSKRLVNKDYLKLIHALISKYSCCVKDLPQNMLYNIHINILSI